jgi:hypothetical protein
MNQENSDKFWEMTKFRLLSLNDTWKIEEAIESLVVAWSERVDRDTTERFRERLYSLVREGIEEDHRAKKH